MMFIEKIRSLYKENYIIIIDMDMRNDGHKEYCT
jgi:hypothetical protein